MFDDLKQEIKDAAVAPRSSDYDGVQTQERDLRELIEADKHLANKTAATQSPTFGIRFARMSPPGST